MEKTQGIKEKMTRSEYINYYIRLLLLGGFTFIMTKWGGVTPDVGFVAFVSATGLDGATGYITKTIKTLKEIKYGNDKTV